MPNCIPLDPKLPANFDNTPNEKRSKSQINAWWDHPYGITQPDGKIMVRCLNGGAWDRSSFLGMADSYDEACALAETKQKAWVDMRSQPTFMYSLEPPFTLIQQPQRPDHGVSVIAQFGTMDEMNLFSLKTTKRQLVDVAPTLPFMNMTLAQLAWYKNELDMSISSLRNEATAIEVLRDEVVGRIKEEKTDKDLRLLCSLLRTIVDKHGLTCRHFVLQAYGVKYPDELKPMLGQYFADADKEALLRPLVENEAVATELRAVMAQEQERRNLGGLYRDEDNNLYAVSRDEDDE